MKTIGIVKALDTYWQVSFPKAVCRVWLQSAVDERALTTGFSPLPIMGSDHTMWSVLQANIISLLNQHFLPHLLRFWEGRKIRALVNKSFSFDQFISMPHPNLSLSNCWGPSTKDILSAPGGQSCLWWRSLKDPLCFLVMAVSDNHWRALKHLPYSGHTLGQLN